MNARLVESKHTELFKKAEREKIPVQSSTHDPIRMFVRDLRRVKVSQKILTREEVTVLIRKIRRGERGSLSARDTLIVANLRLVISIAKRYSNMGISLLDLVNEGVFGLVTAIERFKPSKKFMFSTYATPWIRQAVGRAVSNQNSTVRVPVHIQDRVAKVRKAEQKLVSRGVSFPTVEEIARVAQMGRKEVRKVIESPRHLVISLEQPRESVSEEQEGVFAETIPDETIVSPKEMMERRLLISIFFHKVKDMEKVLSKLRITDKKRDIFRFKYGLTDNSFINRRLQETGDHFGVTRERVRQIVVDVWKRLARRNRWVSEFQTSLEQVTRLGRTEDVSSLIMNSL